MKKVLLLAVLLLTLCFAVSCSCDGEETVTVNFDSHTDEKIPAVEVPLGGKVTEPVLQEERPGYSFVGWFDGEKKWDFQKNTVEKDVTLSAKWESYLSYASVSEIESAQMKELYKDYPDGVIVTGCDRLKTETVKIPTQYNGKTVVGVAPFAFADNKNIKSVYIPLTVEVVGEGAFFGCTSLEKITAEAKEAPLGWSDSIINTSVHVEFKK